MNFLQKIQFFGMEKDCVGCADTYGGKIMFPKINEVLLTRENLIRRSFMELDFHNKFRTCIQNMEKLGNEYAEAKGQSWQMQELKSSVLAKIINRVCVDGISQSKSETLARADEDYQTYIKETASAITKELKLKSQYEKEKAVFEALRSLSSLEKKIIEKT
jgi:hypothetical protein